MRSGSLQLISGNSILNFRHLLERHGLTETIFADVNAHLADKGITLRSGTLVDATIIDAPSSTKNKVRARDPEMSSTKKGNNWCFGVKADSGVDADSGVTHSLDTSTAKLHGSQVWDELLHCEESSALADKGYVNAEREAAFAGPGKAWGVVRKAIKGRPMHPLDEQAIRIIAMVRAKVEHPFRVIKRQFGHVKTRYRGLAKNRAQLFTLFALGNLFLVRRKLMACGRVCPRSTKPPSWRPSGGQTGHQTSPLAGNSHSDCQLGAAERVDQTFPRLIWASRKALLPQLAREYVHPNGCNTIRSIGNAAVVVYAFVGTI